ncbi:MAG TPA: hypothetical protein VFJ15_11660, partial [Oleiagrimonas sp.]|nr:hypothetical protein [Oleiagrimonas sp.]
MHVAGLPLRGHILANYIAGRVANDKALPEAERERILSEYANIAAANVAMAVPLVRSARTIFVGHDKSLNVMQKLMQPGSSGVNLSYGNMRFVPTETSSAHATFQLDGALASLTLRPYLSGKAFGCHRDKADAYVRVIADGKDVYAAWLSPKTFRLVTLDVRGVDALDVVVDNGVEASGDSGCARVMLKVPQMLCYDASCVQPGPYRDQLAPSSRILTNDPMRADIEHLASMRPLAKRRVSGKMSNLRWMLSRQVAKQQGYGSFKAQPDAQLFMHPGVDHAAWIDFDVSGLSRIELTPRINKLDHKCLSLDTPKQRVGIVDVRFILDGKLLRKPIVVDRDFASNVALQVDGGHTLRISVTKHGPVNWCDWFSVGFPELDGPAAPTGVNAAH